MENTKLIYDVESKPPFGKLLLFAFQQVLAVLAATIAVPNILNLPISVPAAILGAGLGTLVYLLFTKFKSPVIISSSFAFLGALANAMAFGYFGILLGSVFAGLVYVVIAIIVKFAGVDWIYKLMPPQIIGPVVALIGLSLAGNAVGDLTKANSDGINGGYNLVALFCGLAAFFTIIICSCQSKFKNLKLIPFIIGILVGYALASIFSIIGFQTNTDYLKIIDWSPLINNFKNFNINSIFSVPQISLVEGIRELATGTIGRDMLEAAAAAHMGDAEFAANLTVAMALEGAKSVSELSRDALELCLKSSNYMPQVITGVGVAEIALAFIPVALVTFAEHVADHHNLGTIIGRHLMKEEPGLTRTLLGDGVGSIVGTGFGICPNTTYGESVGCVAITRNASVRTIFVAALMLIVLAFLAPITSALKTIPSCVMGGVCLTLYGFIAISGLKMFKNIDLGENKSLFTVAVILIAGIGGLAIKIPYQINDDGSVAKVITITSIATALILGIVTNKICEAIEKKSKKEAK